MDLLQLVGQVLDLGLQAGALGLPLLHLLRSTAGVRVLALPEQMAAVSG